jgi:uncharacterized protein YozE (UPF0346 family)
MMLLRKLVYALVGCCKDSLFSLWKDYLSSFFNFFIYIVAIYLLKWIPKNYKNWFKQPIGKGYRANKIKRAADIFIKEVGCILECPGMYDYTGMHQACAAPSEGEKSQRVPLRRCKVIEECYIVFENKVLDEANHLSSEVYDNVLDNYFPKIKQKFNTVTSYLHALHEFRDKDLDMPKAYADANFSEKIRHEFEESIEKLKEYIQKFTL